MQVLRRVLVAIVAMGFLAGAGVAADDAPLVLVVADLVARTAIAHAELPLGMLTSLVGGPFFFWLLRRTRTSQGGWA